MHFQNARKRLKKSCSRKISGFHKSEKRQQQSKRKAAHAGKTPFSRIWKLCKNSCLFYFTMQNAKKKTVVTPFCKCWIFYMLHCKVQFFSRHSAKSREKKSFFLAFGNCGKIVLFFCFAFFVVKCKEKALVTPFCKCLEK